ncbi:MAG: DUF975 family protein [Christensenellales bacterium]
MRAELKKEAKGFLKDNWKILVLVVVITTALTTIVSAIYNAINADISVQMNQALSAGNMQDYYELSLQVKGGWMNTVAMIVTSGLTLALMNCFLTVSRKGKVAFSDFSSKLALFVQSLVLSILIGLIVGLGLILLIVPGVIWALGYSMSYFIKLDNPELGVWECMKRSKKLMCGRKADFFVLILSFIGWLLLAGIAAGVISMILGLIGRGFVISLISALISCAITALVSSYVYTTFAVYYNKLIDYGRETEEKSEPEEASLPDEPVQE